MGVKLYGVTLNMKMIFLDSDNGNGIPKGGFLIGVLERLIIIFAVAFKEQNRLLQIFL